MGSLTNLKKINSVDALGWFKSILCVLQVNVAYYTPKPHYSASQDCDVTSLATC